MIIVLKPGIDTDSREWSRLDAYIGKFPNIETLVHRFQGTEKLLTEIHLIGNTAALSLEEIRSFSGVDHAVRVSEQYRVLGRHEGDQRPNSFTYNGVTFSQENLNV